MMGCCISGNSEDHWDPAIYYAIRSDCRNEVPKPRFRPKSGRTLSARRWHSYFNEDGRLDIAKVLLRIQRGGIHPSIKGAVWEFLLGCYDPNSTFDERSQLRQRRRSEYNELKSKCQDMEPTIGSGKILTTAVITEDGQPIEVKANFTKSEKKKNNVRLEKDVIRWKVILHQIGLDVVRTDRALVYYEKNGTDAKLWDILSVYAWIDKDIGYCQGMNDLCSPITILVENEADAFWCFERLMRRMRANFKCTTSSIGVRAQLKALASVIKTVDPKLHEHLETLDGGEYLFALRMLMVLFRREFSFVDALYLWEMWAMEYNPNLFSLYEPSGGANGSTETAAGEALLKRCGKFERKRVRAGEKVEDAALSIFLAAGVLELKSKRLLKEAGGLEEVAEILNEITGTLDAKKACKEALKIHKKYLMRKVGEFMSS